MRNCAERVRLKPDATADCRRRPTAVWIRPLSSVESALRRTFVIVAIIASASIVSAQPSNATRLFKDAQTREAELRHDIETRKAGAQATPLLQRARTLV